MNLTKKQFDELLNAKKYEELEPYRVKRAVFLAAGFGQRLVPVTLKTPKPLVEVNGTRIIDTLLNAVKAAGIDDIIIVRGHLKEQFDQLLEKYPNIKFVDNDLYSMANNISSVLCVRGMLENAYVLESDLFLKNPALITKYQYTSNYIGVPAVSTNDWCFETENGIITKVKIGGENCHHMFGISYWNSEDGVKLSGHINEAFQMPGGNNFYWDEVPLKYFINEYKISVRNCTFDDIIEIDTLDELIALDKKYSPEKTA